MDVGDLLEDHATSRVPESRTVGGLRVGLLYSAQAFSVPGLVGGVKIGSALGLLTGVGAFLAGGLFLAVLGAVTAVIGAKTRLTSYLLIQFAFGVKGSKAVNLAFAISQFGWFGVQLGLFARAAQGLAADQLGVNLGEAVYILAGGLLMVVSTMFGFRLLNRLALFVVPLMVALMAVLLYLVFSDRPLSAILDIAGTGTLTFNGGVAATVGGLILGAVLIPDVTRFVKTSWDGVLASILTFLVASTLVYVVAAMASLATGTGETLQIMVAVGLGTGAFALVVCSTWTANSINLYGSSLSMSAVVPRFAGWRMTVVCGTVGTLGTFLGILDHFVPFLIYLSVLFTPVGSIYIVDFFFVRNQQYHLEDLPKQPAISWPALAAWMVGSAASYATAEQFMTLSGSSTIDALLVPAIVYILLMKVRRAGAAAPGDRGAAA